MALTENDWLVVHQGDKTYKIQIKNLSAFFLNLNKERKISGKLSIEPAGNTGRNFEIRGETSSKEDDPNFFYTYYNAPGQLDAINYAGKMESSNNIVNVGYVEEAIGDYRIIESGGSYYIESR